MIARYFLFFIDYIHGYIAILIIIIAVQQWSSSVMSYYCPSIHLLYRLISGDDTLPVSVSSMETTTLLKYNDLHHNCIEPWWPSRYTSKLRGTILGWARMRILSHPRTSQDKNSTYVFRCFTDLMSHSSGASPRLSVWWDLLGWGKKEAFTFISYQASLEYRCMAHLYFSSYMNPSV